MKNRYVLVGDLLLIPTAAFAAFVGRFDVGFLAEHAEFRPYVLAALVTKPIVFALFGMYRRYWRYTSIQDLTVVFLAVTASSLGMALYVALMFGSVFQAFSRVVLFNDWLLTLATTGGLRLAIRIVNEKSWGDATDDAGSVPRRVLVVGAGAAGTMVVREMRRNPQLGMKPIGFVDDDPEKVGHYLAGIRVLGDTKVLAGTVTDHRIDHVVIAMPTVRGSIVRRIVDDTRAVGVSAQTIPGIFELLGGQASINRLRTVAIEDLLRRSHVTSTGDRSGVVGGKVVMITGAGGSIGSELARQVANAGPSRLVLLGHGENSLFEAEARLRAGYPGVRISTVIADTRDRGRLALVFDAIRPDVVFHAAAHKHVPLMEDNPEEAVTNNVRATQYVVEQALRVGVARFVLISTDKAVSPTSIMGASKRLAEGVVRQAAQRSGRAFVVVRFGNVLGSRGSVVHTFKQQIEAGGPVTVTHPEMTRYFMTIPEAVHLVLHASGEGKGGELFVLDMGDPVRIVDLARDLISLSGLDEDEIPIIFTGMRTGEKLHERLFDPEMRTRPTTHPDVLEVVGDDPCVSPSLDRTLESLDDAARRGDRRAILSLLQAAIPSFVPDARHLQDQD